MGQDWGTVSGHVPTDLSPRTHTGWSQAGLQGRALQAGARRGVREPADAEGWRECPGGVGETQLNGKAT